jgi:hypothetical protein
MQNELMPTAKTFAWLSVLERAFLKGLALLMWGVLVIVVCARLVAWVGAGNPEPAPRGPVEDIRRA